MDKEKWFEEKSATVAARLNECKRKAAILAMTKDLSEVPNMSPEQIQACAEIAVDKGYRKIRQGAWLLDDAFESQSKIRYKCSQCGYWQVSKAQNRTSMLRSLRYCPGCGARMEKPREDVPEEET